MFLWEFILVSVIILTDVVGVGNVYLEIFEDLYRIGRSSSGGGQVVLAMLQDVVVPMWKTNNQFLQGRGLAQNVPGPLLNFAEDSGAVYKGVPGALMAYCSIFGAGANLIWGGR
jgi:chromate transport protein ChrA